MLSAYRWTACPFLLRQIYELVNKLLPLQISINLEPLVFTTLSQDVRFAELSKFFKNSAWL